MKQPLHDEQLELYLQKQLKNHRMYAADGVWRNIQNSLHVEKSWPALTFISIILIAAITAGTLLTKPNTNLLKSQYHPATQESIAVSETENKASTEALRKHLSADNLRSETITAAETNLQEAAQNENVAYQTLPLSNNEAAITQSSPIAEKYFTKINIADNKNYLTAADASNINKNVEDSKIVNADINYNAYPAFSFMQPINNFKAKNLFFTNSFFTKPAFSFKNNKPFLGNWFSLPAYVSNESKKVSKWIYEIYATPSFSYRRLFDVNSGHSPQTFVSSLPESTTYAIDVNKTVQHKPALGLEGGVALGYKISKQLTLKTGLQFNMRQYYIIADDISAQSPSDNISLLSDTSINVSNRSVPASYSLTLTDRYYEISLPVGIDWKVASINKFSLGVAASLQPTYTFSKHPFLVTSDFKNYSDGSVLMRKWNLNTTFETYFAYKTGSLTWQVGPQFRYQQLPAFSSQYPVREHLLDYGLKIGFTKSIK